MGPLGPGRGRGFSEEGKRCKAGVSRLFQLTLSGTSFRGGFWIPWQKQAVSGSLVTANPLPASPLRPCSLLVSSVPLPRSPALPGSFLRCAFRMPGVGTSHRMHRHPSEPNRGHPHHCHSVFSVACQQGALQQASCLSGCPDSTGSRLAVPEGFQLQDTPAD